MINYGFVKVASAIPTVRVADCKYNSSQICELINEAEDKNCDYVVFPELSITGYTCQDLFHQATLIASAREALYNITLETINKHVIAIVGTPLMVDNALYNCAVVIADGFIKGIVAKTHLPNYGEFYEKRWFASSQDIIEKKIDIFDSEDILFTNKRQVFEDGNGIKFGIEICEDLWSPIPPSNHLTLDGADIIFNLSASDELVGKHRYLENLVSQQSARTICGYVYTSCGFGESTQDLVYCGKALIYENGEKLLNTGEYNFIMRNHLTVNEIDVEKLRIERMKNSTFMSANRMMKTNSANNEAYNIKIRDFEYSLLCNLQLHRTYKRKPFIPEKDTDIEGIFQIQTMGLIKRLKHINCQKVVIGISGGLDSTLALLVCIRAFDQMDIDRKGIIGITMPCFGTTKRTLNNSKELMEKLGITSYEINITKAVEQHFKDIEQDPDNTDITYENCQARERTQVLMDMANKHNAIVIGTGDMSELALGWATYNGDHMSMYNVNVSIPKTLCIRMVRYASSSWYDYTPQKDVFRKPPVYENEGRVREILRDICDTPISPELKPTDDKGELKQKTENSIGPYELHDFFLYHMIRYCFSPDKVFFIAKYTFGTKYTEKEILKWLTVFIKRFFSQQFKRSCLPDGPKVGSVCLSPRGDWRMPSDACNNSWFDALKTIPNYDKLID